MEAGVRSGGQRFVARRDSGGAVRGRCGDACQPEAGVAVVHLPAEMAGIVVVPAPRRVGRLGVVGDTVGVGMEGRARHVHPGRPEMKGGEDRDGQGMGSHQQQAHASSPAVRRYADHAPRDNRVRARGTRRHVQTPARPARFLP